MTKSLRGRAAIVGIGLAGCGEAPGYTELDLAAEAARRAVADAGLTMRDIDGVVTASLETNVPVLSLAEYLGIQPSFSDGTGIGGSSFIAHLIPAAMALEQRLCDAVLIAYGSTARKAQQSGLCKGASGPERGCLRGGLSANGNR
jgi:3-oxoacyl-[acyl-carrier-protein] synthase III